MPIIICQRIPDPNQMHDRGQHDQDMEDVVRAPPNVEFARFDRLRTAGAVEEGAQHQNSALKEIIRHPRCHPHMVPAIDDQAVSDRNTTGQTQA